MLSWITANMGTLVLCAGLLAAVFGILRSLLRKKRKGGACCGCAHCPMNGQCRCPPEHPE